MVKTYRLEPYERTRMGEAFDERYTLLDRLIRIRAANEPIITVVGGVAIAVIIGIAAYRIDRGLLTGAELVSFLVGMAMLSQPARGLGTLNAVVQEGLSALERVFDVLDRQPTIVDRADAATPAWPRGQALPLRFERVSFAYQGGPPVLSAFDLSVAAGETVALVGPSGAGKSTVFNLVPRLYDPTDGRVLIADHDLRETRLGAVRDAIALVAQDAVLFDDTIEANIRFGRADASFVEVEAAARAAAAHDFITRLPGGYDAQVGDAGSQLSGGQRQRVALARAFLKDAPILLLDEATSALDAESERLIEMALRSLSRGRTTLIIAHRLATVRHADRIVVMDAGRIVEEGTHDELIARNGLYARLAALQFREAEPA
jgi:subfamily B ATP-binding cassette protein MsbA